MPNSVIEDFKNKEDQENSRDNSKALKRFFPVKNTVKLGLLLLALGVLVPTPIQAKRTTQNTQTPAYSFIQQEYEGKDAYSEEEIARGQDRVKNLINYFRQAYKNEGKTENSFEKINDLDHIIDLFSRLYDSLYGKFAKKLEWQIIKFSQFDLIYINGELFDITANNKSFSDDMLHCYQMIEHTIKDHFQSDKSYYGDIKTKEQIEDDKFVAKILKDCVVSKEDIAFIYDEAKNYENNIPSNQIENKEDITSPEQVEKNKRFEKIESNLQFMTGEASKDFRVNKYTRTEEKVFTINGVNKYSINEKKVFSINDELYYSYEKEGEEIERSNANPLQEDSKTIKKEIISVKTYSSLSTQGAIPAEQLLF